MTGELLRDHRRSTRFITERLGDWSSKKLDHTLLLRLLQSILIICFVFASYRFFVSPALGQTKPLWSIYWISDQLPCEGYWGKPMTSSLSACPKIGDIAISICARPKEYPYPFDQGKSITIVGYEIVQILTVPTANGYMAVGSGHGGDAADFFAMTGGVGTNSKAGNLPDGTGIPQGGTSEGPTYPHIDVYGFCDTGTQRALVNIFYTSP